MSLKQRAFRYRNVLVTVDLGYFHKSLINVNDEEENALLERVKEESLKYYKEIELPRISKESNSQPVGISDVSVLECQGPSKVIWYDGKEAEGFYLAAGSTYIYPTNYPVREYQERIVKTALFKNTLVSLPTGLGKTFIAAVVMYNYYRWYPNGKVVFMAPTRPLVAQQIKACYNIMGMPMEDTTEMTGSLNVQERIALWQHKRVFFLTPQVMVNDIKSKSCPAAMVKCLVVDEAHRAVKDYAYCHVVSLLHQQQAVFRVLALSATPGNDVNGVVQVVRNLQISSLEFRGEDALDVIKYTHKKSVQSVVVSLSINIQRVKGDFLQVYDKYAKRLREHKALNCNISTVTKFQILKASEKFRSHPPRGLASSLVGSIICDFSVCMSLAHSLELLQIYGLRAFHSYLNEGGDKNKAAATRLKKDDDLKKILDRLQGMLKNKPGEEGYVWGHPKLYKLTSILTEHFKTAKEQGEKTKAIIFCQYRVVVNEVLEILTNLNSDIKPVMFIGQSSSSCKDKGMTQARQLEIMKHFRVGLHNCMIATCVAEEGLDIGEVDLIVLMEAHKSPIRLVQRLGRTGRKRNGKCVVLVTEGREEYKFQEAMAARKSYVSSVLNAKTVREKLCADSPSMLPPGIQPQRQLLHIEVVQETCPHDSTATVPSKQVDIRACLEPHHSPFLTSDQYKQIIKVTGNTSLPFDKLPKSDFLFHRINDEKMLVDELLRKDLNIFSEWNDWNLQLQESHEISHTADSELMCGLLNRFYSFDVNFFNLSKADKEWRKRKREVINLSDEDDDDPLMNKRGKRNKKETHKINYGMDIRHCMAATSSRLTAHSAISRLHQVIDIDALEVIDTNSTTLHCQSNAKLLEDVIQSLEKELKLVLISNNCQSKLYSPFEDDFISTLDFYSSSSFKKKTTCLFSTYESLSKNESSITSRIVSQLENIKIETAVKTLECCEEDSGSSIDWDNVVAEPAVLADEGSPQSNLSSLVDVDHLFHSASQQTDKQQASSPPHRSSQQQQPPTPHRKTNISLVHNQFAKSEFKQTHNKIHDSGNASDNCKSSNNFENGRPITPFSKESENCWDSIPNEFFYSRSAVTPVKRMHLASSTPKISKSIILQKANQNLQSPILKDTDDSVWNLDDLFEGNQEEETEASGNLNKGPVENLTAAGSTMLGITQMVSMIEKEKLASSHLESANLHLNISQFSDIIISQDNLENLISNNTNNPEPNKVPQIINKNFCSENSNNIDKGTKHLLKDRSLLDEDDELFTSLTIVGAGSLDPPAKPYTADNVTCHFKNCSSDIFNSTIFQSKYFNIDSENISHNQINSFRKSQSPILKHDSVNEISEGINHNEAKQNEHQLDDSIVLLENLFDLSTDNKSNSNKSIGEELLVQNSPTVQCQQSPVTAANQLCTQKNLNVQHSDLAARRENQNIDKGIIHNPCESCSPFKVHVPAARFKGNGLNFKRFVSNKSKPVSSQISNDCLKNSNDEPSQCLVTVSQREEPHCTSPAVGCGAVERRDRGGETGGPGPEPAGLDESWWFDFDFPSHPGAVTPCRHRPPPPPADRQTDQQQPHPHGQIHQASSSTSLTHRETTHLLAATPPLEPSKTASKPDEQDHLRWNIKYPKHRSLNNKQRANKQQLIMCQEQHKSLSPNGSNKENMISTLSLDAATRKINNISNHGSDAGVLKEIEESLVVGSVSDTLVQNYCKNYYSKQCTSNTRKTSFQDCKEMKDINKKGDSHTDGYKKSTSKKILLLEGSDDDDGIFLQDPISSKNCSKTSNASNSAPKTTTLVKSSKNGNKKRARKHCAFIESEAGVSEDNSGTSSGGNDDSSDLDELDQSFIDDQEPSINIHAKYLQSVKSPIHGKYKIPENLNNISNVYSQYDCNDTEEYVNDSFCVDSAESSGEENQLSEIEIAEKKLQDKKRKSNKHQSNNTRKLKRRRIKHIDSDNSNEKDSSITPLKESKTPPTQSHPGLKKKKLFIIPSDSDASDNSPLLMNKRSSFTSGRASKPPTRLAKHPSKSVQKDLHSFIRETTIKKSNLKVDMDVSDEDLLLAISQSQQEFHNYISQRRVDHEQLEQALPTSQPHFTHFNQQPSTSTATLPL